MRILRSDTDNSGAIKLPNPGINWNWIISLLATVIGPIVRLLTASIREQLQTTLLDLYNKAESTPNPWDDFLIELFLRMLGIPVPPNN